MSQYGPVVRDTGESSAKAALRRAVLAIEKDIAGLSDQMTTPTDRARLHELLDSWPRLVELLALGPVPEIRQCPVCTATVMRAATRCIKCWSRLTPQASAEE